MIVYALLFLYFVVGATLERPRGGAQAADAPPARSVMLLFGGLLIVLIVGLRYQVGADWTSYVQIFRDTSLLDLGTALGRGDPGYEALNWLVQQIGADIWLVNLICALLFAWGLFRFAECLPRPWLAMVVAVPYLVIVVAEGYTRQAVAIGVIMAGIATYLRTGSAVRLAFYVLGAALFHKTAVVALPLMMIGNGRSRVATPLIILAITYELYDLLLAPSVGNLVSDYSSSQSQGALIRVAMSSLAAVLFLLRGRKLQLDRAERVVWRNFSLASLICLALLYIYPESSTAVDRMGLYLIPLQLAVLSRPEVLGTTERLGTGLIIVYSGLIEFTWLAFASHAQYWLPYRFWPFAA